jgi:hypothetical protein
MYFDSGHGTENSQKNIFKHKFKDIDVSKKPLQISTSGISFLENIDY